ncbi:hypothetical protein HGRIS_000288 [Hohenbuehelia grisea]|uniref:Uncharacterized protein n=1 Tax=Hohenbuehelia grisea TaxID=104357 RepID=A0ABR3JR73_9AGAR
MVGILSTVYAKPINTRASVSFLHGDLGASTTSIVLLGQCVQELVPPTGALAAGCLSHIGSVGATFDDLAADLTNTTLTVSDATAFIAGLNETLGHLNVTLQLIADAFPAFSIADQADDEDFDLDDVPESVGDAGESLDGVFDSLADALPNAALRNQATKLQEATAKDISDSLRVFGGGEDLVGGNSTVPVKRAK